MSNRRSSLIVAAFAAVIAASSCSTSSVPQWKRDLTERPSTGPDEDPDARDRWYWEQRAAPTGIIPVDVHRAAVLRELHDARALDSSDTLWANIGPAPLRNTPNGGTRQNSSGRVLTIAIAPNDPNTILLGTAQGGIWKTTDRGASFRAVDERSLPTLAIGVIRYSPADPNVVYAGTGEGAGGKLYGVGMLRSTDGGETWQQLPSHGAGWDFDYASISALQFDTNDANTLYITTATIGTASVINPQFRTPPNPPQTGIFKSTDGGQSWTLLYAAKRYVVGGGPAPAAGFLDLENGGPAAPRLFYATEYYGGILRSEDGGATWTRITPVKSSGLGTFPAAIGKVVYFDEEAVRNVMATRLPNDASVPDVRRIELGVSPANPNIVYAGYAAANNQLDLDGDGVYDDAHDVTVEMPLLFKSVDRGATWRWLGSRAAGIPDYCGTQCSYDNVLTVNPNNANDILIGGMANYDGYAFDPQRPGSVVEMPWHGMVYRSIDGGSSWLDLTPHCTKVSSTSDDTPDLKTFTCMDALPSKVTHPDIHAIVFGPGGAIYVGSDGGLTRGTEVPTAKSRRRTVSTNDWSFMSGLSYDWENLNNGIATLQFYHVASHPTDPNILIGGMQDNASGAWNGSSWVAWVGGDGTIAGFDAIDPRHVYLGSQFTIYRNDAGGGPSASWRTIFGASKVASGEAINFVPVFAVDPTTVGIVYATTNKGLYRSKSYGDGMTRLLPGQNTDGIPTSISVSPVDHTVVWVGTTSGAIYRYSVIDNITASATNVANGLPGRYVSAVAASQQNAATVYAVFNGYDVNTPGTPGKVFVSDDSGATWKNISGDLPPIPATAIALDPKNANRLWVATDTAVYVTTDRGVTWTSERRNMPVVSTQDLNYNAKTGFLVAATFGRGVWRMPITAAAAQ
jgi:photosystem II stability/assembly factor-like uncharacterized protein